MTSRLNRTTVACAAASVLLLGACAQGTGGGGSTTDPPAAGGGEPVGTDDGDGAPRVALIGDQRFGDQGPMDDMAAGLEQCAEDFGFQTKTFESIEAAGHEDDVRAVAAEGYDLIFTTFPHMTPATSAVAVDYPDTLFGAVYQFINVDGASVPNVWDTEYRGDSTYFIAGAAAATLSQTGRLGFVSGDQDPTITAAVNGMIQGARSVDPDVVVEAAVAGSYEDPAKGKDIAKAMLSRDIDVIVTAAAKTQLGVLDGVVEGGALMIGDVGDYSDRAPENFLSYVGSSFGQNVYLGCQMLDDGNFTGGEHTFIDLTNDGYFFPTDPVTAWGEATGREDDAQEIVELAEQITEKVKSGDLDVEHITEWPTN